MIKRSKANPFSRPGKNRDFFFPKNRKISLPSAAHHCFFTTKPMRLKSIVPGNQTRSSIQKSALRQTKHLDKQNPQTNNLKPVMKPLSYALLAAAAACGLASAAETAYTTPVGYYDFDGKAGGNLFVPSLVKPAAFAGVITGSTSTTLTTSGLTAGAYNEGAVYATHYVEITSGPNAGTTVDIVSNTATVVTLASDISGLSLAGTESITIRPHVTLKSALESAEAGLTAFNDVATFYAIDGSSTSYIYGADGGTGWSSDFATADGNLRPIAAGTGVVLGLLGDVPLTVTGEVKSSPTVVQLGLGFVNIVGPLNPLVGTTVPLNNTGLGDLVAFTDGITVYVPGPLDTSVSYVPLGDGTLSSDFVNPTTDTLNNTTGAVVVPSAGASVKLNSGL